MVDVSFRNAIFALRYFLNCDIKCLVLIGGRHLLDASLLIQDFGKFLENYCDYVKNMGQRKPVFYAYFTQCVAESLFSKVAVTT